MKYEFDDIVGYILRDFEISETCGDYRWHNFENLWSKITVHESDKNSMEVGQRESHEFQFFLNVN